MFALAQNSLPSHGDVSCNCFSVPVPAAETFSALK